MCIHPEAITRAKNFIFDHGTDYHTVYDSQHRLPQKGYWVVRNSSYYRPTKMDDAGEIETASSLLE